MILFVFLEMLKTGYCLFQFFNIIHLVLSSLKCIDSSDKVFKSGLSKFCERQTLKEANQIRRIFFHVHSWILYSSFTAWKVSIFGVILARIFLHSDWIRRDTSYLSIFSPKARKYGPEYLRIRTLFTQCFCL